VLGTRPWCRNPIQKPKDRLETRLWPTAQTDKALRRFLLEYGERKSAAGSVLFCRHGLFQRSAELFGGLIQQQHAVPPHDRPQCKLSSEMNWNILNEDLANSKVKSKIFIRCPVKFDEM
jgi:hypothetical protein